MSNIIAFSGKKVSGKNTAINFIIGVNMLNLGIVRKDFFITPEGQLHISDIFGDESFRGIFDINRRNETMKNFLEENLNPFVKVYSFASMLKDEVCIKILGLTDEQCYGTNEQKDSLTNLRWENMPGLDTLEKQGLMTAREVMQYVGSNIFRKMHFDVWADATIRLIQYENSNLALISDCRFPNEVEVVQKAGGKVIRLTRNPLGDKDQHISETALNNYTGFDYVLDNSEMLIPHQNEAIYKLFENWGIFPKVEEITT